jgi:hypothetical protein
MADNIMLDDDDEDNELGESWAAAAHRHATTNPSSTASPHPVVSGWASAAAGSLGTGMRRSRYAEMLALQVAVSAHSLPDEQLADPAAVVVEETVENADNGEQSVVEEPDSVLGKLLQLAQKKQAILSSIKGVSIQV